MSMDKDVKVLLILRNGLAGMVEQLNEVLNDIAVDMPKAVGSPQEKPQQVAKTVQSVQALFPQEIGSMLFFTEEGEYIVAKPRQYLGSENFAKIASIVRGAGGEYISAGKESHFRV